MTVYISPYLWNIYASEALMAPQRIGERRPKTAVFLTAFGPSIGPCTHSRSITQVQR